MVVDLWDSVGHSFISPFADSSFPPTGGENKAGAGSTRASHRQQGAFSLYRSQILRDLWALQALLAHMQPGFGMIQVELDATQNFVIDDILITQPNDRPALHVERVLLQTLIRGRDQPIRAVPANAGANFQPANAVEVLSAESLQEVRREVAIDFRKVSWRRFICFEPRRSSFASPSSTAPSWRISAGKLRPWSTSVARMTQKVMNVQTSEFGLNSDQLNAHHTIAAAMASAATIMMNALNLFIGFSLFYPPNRSLRSCLRPCRRADQSIGFDPWFLTGCQPGCEHAEPLWRNKFVAAFRGHEKYGHMAIL
jgi:hypothetical protein